MEKCLFSKRKENPNLDVDHIDDDDDEDDDDNYCDMYAPCWAAAAIYTALQPPLLSNGSVNSGPI
jgi:hypothetical protein